LFAVLASVTVAHAEVSAPDPDLVEVGVPVWLRATNDAGPFTPDTMKVPRNYEEASDIYGIPMRVGGNMIVFTRDWNNVTSVGNALRERYCNEDNSYCVKVQTFWSTKWIGQLVIEQRYGRSYYWHCTV